VFVNFELLDHQLRVQQHSSPQGQSLQAVAALLNNTANAGIVHVTKRDVIRRSLRVKWVLLVWIFK